MPGQGFWGQTKPPPGTPIDRTGLRDRGIKAVWLFNTGAGAVWDVVGGLRATPSGAAPYDGKSFSYNGSTQDLRGSGLVLANKSFTISTLFSPRNLTANPSCLVNVGSVGSTDQLLHVEIKGSGFGVQFNFWSDDNNGMSAPTLLDGTVYRVTATFDSTSKLQTVYLFGHPDGQHSQTRTATGNFTGDTTFRFGSRANGAGDDWLTGLQYDVFVWDYALGAAQATAHYYTPYADFAAPVWRRYFIPSSGTVYNRTVTATQAQSATLQKQPNLIRPLTQAQTLALQKQAALSRSASQAQAATLQKQANLTRSAIQTQSASLVALKVLIRTVSTTQAQVASLLKQANVIRSATQSQSTALQKQPNLVRSATQSQTVTLQKQANLTRSTTQAQALSITSLKVLIRIVTATQAQVASLIKTVQSIRAASQAQSATVAKQANVTRSVSQAQATTLQKQGNLTRSTSQAQAVSIMTLKVLIRIVTASQAQVVSLVKSVMLTRSAAQPQAVTLSKLATLTRLLSQAQAAAVSWIKILAGAGTPGRHTVTDQATNTHTVSDAPL